MAEDILLTVGISLESLKKAQARIDAELKTWKAPSALDISPIDKKSLSDTEKLTRAFRTELGKLGTAIGKDKLSDYLKIDPGVAVNASKAFKVISDGTSDAGNQMSKLAQTTELSKIKNDIYGESLSSVKNELNSYFKEESSGITFEKRIIDLKTQLTSVTGDQTIAIQNEIAATQVALDRKNQLITSYTKLEKAQKGFFHGIDLPRLMLWAVGWKIMYGALNIVLKGLSDIATTVVEVNSSLDSVRAANLETAKSFDAVYASIKRSVYATSQDSLVSAQKLAKAFRDLTFEGAKTGMALAALVHVRELMTLTGEKENVVASALIETYGLFKDKITGATTESEKLARISDGLAILFTRAHVSISEYQQIMSFLGVTAADAVPSFEYLIKLMVYADDAMLEGRRAGMALLQVLTGLAEDTSKLKEIGIAVKYGESTDALKMLQLIQHTVAGLNEEAKKDVLGKIFKGQTLQLVIKLLNETDLSLSKVVGSFDNMSKSQEEAIKRSHFFARAFNDAINFISNGISTSLDATNRFFSGLADKQRAYEEDMMARGMIAKDTAYLDKTGAEALAKAAASAKAAREEAERRKPITLQIADAEGKIYDIVWKTREEFDKQAIAAMRLVGIERNKLDALKLSYEIKKLEASGASIGLVAQEKSELAILKAVGFIEDSEERTKAIVAIREAQYSDIETLYKTVNYYAKDQKAAEQAVNEILDARFEVYQKIAEEVKSLADSFEGVAVDFVKKLTTGTLDIKGLLSGIMDAYKTAFSEQIVKMFGESTGIFANMATSFMGPLQKAHYTGIQTAIPMIVQAHIDGITQGMAGAGGQGGGTQQSSGGGLMGNIQGLMGMLGGGGYGTKGGKVGPPTQSDAAMQKFGEYAGKAMAVASFGLEMSQAYKAKGSGNPWGTAMNLGMSGAMAGLAVGGPIGAVVGGAIGAIMGGIQGSRSKTTSETQTQTKEITSAIKISNKELQLVNRNLEGIKKGFEGFIFQRSAYFSERIGVEERFNIDRSRGLM